MATRRSFDPDLLYASNPGSYTKYENQSRDDRGQGPRSESGFLHSRGFKDFRRDTSDGSGELLAIREDDDGESGLYRVSNQGYRNLKGDGEDLSDFKGDFVEYEFIEGQAGRAPGKPDRGDAQPEARTRAQNPRRGRAGGRTPNKQASGVGKKSTILTSSQGLGGGGRGTVKTLLGG